MTRIRVAVIGCGAISKYHLDYLASDSRVDIVGVCDRSVALTEWTRQRYGVDRAFNDSTEMLQTTHPEAVHVLTPPAFHEQLTLDALAVGAHVVCEKPMAPSLAQIERLVAAARRADRHLIECHNYRFNDETQWLADMAARGDLGEVCDVDVEMALDVASGGRFSDPNLPSPTAGLAGGAIHDFITHLSYLALMFHTGAEVDDVWARWVNRSGDANVGFDELLAVVMTSTGRSTIRFSSRSRPEGLRLTVRGTKGTASVDLYKPFSRVDVERGSRQLTPLLNNIHNSSRLVRDVAKGVGGKIMQKDPQHGMTQMFRGFYDAVAGTGPLPVTPDDILGTARLVARLTDFAVAS
jgi:predicted dehydrogenase